MTNALRFAGTEQSRLEELEANSSLRANLSRQRSAELAARTKEFLAKGKTIEVIPRGVSARDEAEKEERGTQLDRIVRASVDRHRGERAEASARGRRAQGKVS